MKPVDFERLKRGHYLVIENKCYEILYGRGEADVVDGKVIQYDEIGLHRENSLAIGPTEYLLWYPELQIAIFKKGTVRVKLSIEDIDWRATRT